MKAILDLLGRVFLSAIFLYEAVDSFLYFEKTQEKMTLYGITWQQDFLLATSIFVLVLGGVLILTGYRAGFGAFLLLCYFFPLTLILHAFWQYPPGEQRGQAIQLMHDLAVCGGLMLVMVNGAGKYSIKRIFSTIKVRSA